MEVILKIQDIRRAIAEYSALTGVELDIPARVIQVALDDMGQGTTMAEIVSRYIGAHDSLRSVAQALARQSYPTQTGIDFNTWPFSHIDWEAATIDLGQSLTSGTLLVVDGLYYFDAS